MLDFDLRTVLTTESALTDRLRKAVFIPQGSPIVLGIGDDCAIYRPPGSADDLLFTCDFVAEDVHFRRDTITPRELGRKALARGLSDIAAMGGEPRFCLAALCVPPWASRHYIDSFFDGLLALGSETGTILAGGDLSHGAKFVCDVTVGGAVPRGAALRRDGAKPGHKIYVSGQLGGSALGLATRKGRAWKRHRTPEPRLTLGRFLRKSIRASAAMDLSDGLSLDLRRLCIASGVSAGISLPPRFPGASPDQALHGGEDYELLFTVPPGIIVPPVFQGLPLTPIGTVLQGEAGEISLDFKVLKPLGYDHFKR